MNRGFRSGFFILPLSIFCLLCLSSTLHAGAWVQKKDGAYLTFSASYLRSDKEFNHRGEQLLLLQERLIYNDVSFEQAALTAYGEYGVWSRLTVIGSLPVKVLTSRRTEILASGLSARIYKLYSYGFGDLVLGARYRLLATDWPLALQINLKIPTGYDAFPDNEKAPLGSGKFDVDGNLMAGGTLAGGRIYWSGGLGYRLRGGPLHDQVLMQLEAGYSAGRYLRFRLLSDMLRSTVEPPDIYGQAIVTPIGGGGGTLPEILIGDQHLNKISPAIAVAISDHTWLQIETFHVIAGKNTLAGTTYSLGLIVER